MPDPLDYGTPQDDRPAWRPRWLPAIICIGAVVLMTWALVVVLRAG
jgi:hypothetical protein